MKSTISTIIIFLFVFFSSCNSKNALYDENVIAVDLSNPDKISFYDLFDRIEPIILEMTESSLIKDVTSIYASDSLLYLYDRSYSGQVLMFTSEGEFIQQIGEKGGGPEQFLHISDFAVNFSRKELFILSAIDRKLFVYNLQGEIINVFNLPSREEAFQKMTFLDDDTIVFWCANQSNKLKYYSISGNAIFHESYTEENRDIFCRDPFQVEKALCRGMTNTVYDLSKKELIPLYTWDFGSLNNNLKNIDYPDYNNGNEVASFARDAYGSKIVNYIISLHGSNERYRYAQLIIKNDFYNIFWKKEDRKTLFLKETEEGANMYPIYWTNDYMIGLAFPSLEDVLPPSLRTEEINTKINSLKEDDNPILLKYYFK